MPRGRPNELHYAVCCGSAEKTIALLSSGSIDINETDGKQGATPLMHAANKGLTHIARILLNRGADVSVGAGVGATALHLSSKGGHLEVTRDLIQAGADVHSRSPEGTTAFHLAAEFNHTDVMAALIDAGADADSRRVDGATPLYSAAMEGSLDAVRFLLRRSKPNPMLTSCPFGNPSEKFVPLDAAARYGHPEVVRELLRRFGAKGCGGSSGGEQALLMAAMQQDVEIMAMLTEAGVSDPGPALVTTSGCGRWLAVKLLLRQKEAASWRSGDNAVLSYYVNTRDQFRYTPLFRSIGAYVDHGSNNVYVEQYCPLKCSPKIARLLIEAGANTTSPVRATIAPGGKSYNYTPLAFANGCLREKKVGGKDATEDQLRKLESVRRLLLTVDAVHAISWLWHSEAAAVHRKFSDKYASKTSVRPTTPQPPKLALTLPILRRRARRRGMILAPLFRWVAKIRYQ